MRMPTRVAPPVHVINGHGVRSPSRHKHPHALSTPCALESVFEVGSSQDTIEESNVRCDSLAVESSTSLSKKKEPATRKRHPPIGP
eukprot:3208967-Amphidinium_carterae.1